VGRQGSNRLVGQSTEKSPRRLDAGFRAAIRGDWRQTGAFASWRQYTRDGVGAGASPPAFAFRGSLPPWRNTHRIGASLSRKPKREYRGKLHTP
jgi:hypothetical protein